MVCLCANTTTTINAFVCVSLGLVDVRAGYGVFFAVPHRQPTSQVKETIHRSHVSCFRSHLGTKHSCSLCLSSTCLCSGTMGGKGVAAWGKGKGKGRPLKGQGKGPDTVPQYSFRDCSKGKGKGDVDDEFFKAKGDGWALKYKWCLNAKLAEESPYQFIAKGGPPMQVVYAFDAGEATTEGTDCFCSHTYVDGTSYYELWWTPLPKTIWLCTQAHQWVYMGRCMWQEGESFKPCIWGRYGAGIRCLRGLGSYFA